VDEALAAAVTPGAYYMFSKMGPHTAITVEIGGTPAVLDTDYVVSDANLGIIHVLPDTALTGAVTASYTPTAYASGLTQVRGGTKNQVKGSVLFVGDPTVGPAVKVEVWSASANPDGAVGLISEDWGQMGITLAIESDIVNHPLEPMYRLTYLPY
jgi:hypothetical protein